MKLELPGQVTRLVSLTHTKLRGGWLQLTTAVQSIFRNFRLRLGALTRLSPQSVLLQLVAVTAAAVMVGLMIVGVQTVVQDLASDSAAPQPTEAPQPQPAEPPPGWAGLPLVPSAASPASPTPKAAQKSPAAQKPAQAQAKAASRPSALAESNAASGKATTAPARQAPASGKTAPQVARPASPPAPVSTAVLTQAAPFVPPQEFEPADASNFGDRYAKDIFGKPVHNAPLIVLHETVGSADSALNLFRTRHTDESLQASYHSIIRQDGTVVFIVSSDKRAFGAGNSVFNGPNGPEAVKTHRDFPPSVNNFSYHISLETPPDGDNNLGSHSGYTDAQYRSLAWLIAHTSVPDERITTHRDVDQSGSRSDPRSFEPTKLFSYLRAMPRPYLQPAAS